MGKSYQGVHGNYSGKVGNVVARASKGRTILSIYQPNVANPQTTKQTKVRGIFAMVVEFASKVSSWAGIMMKGDTKYGTGYSNMIRSVYKNDAISNTTPAELLYSRILVSQGSVPLPYNVSGVIDSQLLNVSWSDNTDGDKALSTDKSCALVYNSAKKASVYVLDNSNRASQLLTLTLPTAWSGDSVDIWFSMRREDGSEQSDSFYVGSLSV